MSKALQTEAMNIEAIENFALMHMRKGGAQIANLSDDALLVKIAQKGYNLYAMGARLDETSLVPVAVINQAAHETEYLQEGLNLAEKLMQEAGFKDWLGLNPEDRAIRVIAVSLDRLPSLGRSDEVYGIYDHDVNLPVVSARVIEPSNKWYRPENERYRPEKANTIAFLASTAIHEKAHEISRPRILGNICSKADMSVEEKLRNYIVRLLDEAFTHTWQFVSEYVQVLKGDPVFVKVWATPEDSSVFENQSRFFDGTAAHRLVQDIFKRQPGLTEQIIAGMVPSTQVLESIFDQLLRYPSHSHIITYARSIGAWKASHDPESVSRICRDLTGVLPFSNLDATNTGKRIAALDWVRGIVNHDSGMIIDRGMLIERANELTHHLKNGTRDLDQIYTEYQRAELLHPASHYTWMHNSIASPDMHWFSDDDINAHLVPLKEALEAAIDARVRALTLRDIVQCPPAKDLNWKAVHS